MENSGQHQTCTSEEASLYLELVKSKFPSNSAVYREFLQAMLLYRQQKADAQGTVRRIFHLFDGDETLLNGFEKFLPRGFHIDLHSTKDDNGRPIPVVRYINHSAEIEGTVQHAETSAPVADLQDVSTQLNDLMPENVNQDNNQPEETNNSSETATDLEQTEAKSDEGQLRAAALKGKCADGGGLHHESLIETSGKQSHVLQTVENEGQADGDFDHPMDDSQILAQPETPQDSSPVPVPAKEPQCDDMSVSFPCSNDESSSKLSFPKSHVNGIVNDTMATKVRDSPANSECVDHIAKLSRERRDHHQRLLLRLFSTYKLNELERLEKVAGKISVPPQCTSQQSSRCHHLAFSRIPRILSQSLKSHPENASDERSGVRRPGYAARDISSVERETRTWHASYQTYPSSLTSFTIQFNECSLAAISRWVDASTRKRSRPDKGKNEIPFPCIDPKFRLCLCCNMWGHYESECMEKPRVFDGKPLEGTTPRKYPHRGAARTHTNGKYVVVVEVCEGCVIEQRASSVHPVWTNENTVSFDGLVAVESTEIDGTSITALATPDHVKRSRN